jgi:hypothetical protein
MKALKLVALGAAVATVANLAAGAIAGTGVGGIFNLGKTNTVNAQSILTGSSPSAAQLKVQNTGGDSALSLQVGSGVAPLKVNSSKTVSGLSADTVDGVHAARVDYRAQSNGPNPPFTQRVA